MEDVENRKLNSKNRFQGTRKRVLCVCSAGLLRSPTMAVVLSQPPYKFNTRSCGIAKEYALVVLDDVLLAWADQIVCAEESIARHVRSLTTKPVFSLNIPDNYEYIDPDLCDLIKARYDEVLNGY